ncbi:hypothetical protein [Tolypothrix sp. VBCCA 56010]|uniref:hypothetical protein n=1 Tax=Tolypothrix sp. VBCCA 56010 TaxID=3137731 RepID=UPI003D7E4C25
MKTRNTFVTLTICVLLALTTTFFVNLHKVSARPITDCRKFVTGTYLTTNSGDLGPFRAITTYTQDGNFFFSASNQVVPIQGSDSLRPLYGLVHGSWKCSSDREVTGTTLNFNYPTATVPSTISKTDFRATFDPKAQTVQGTVTIKNFDLDANPLVDDAPEVGTFTFTGQRVKP